jgi:hypothetical protein
MVCDREAAGGRLVAEEAQRLGTRPDEGQSRLGAGARQVRVFAQEAVARVDRIRTAGLRGCEDPGKIEIDEAPRPGSATASSARRVCSESASSSEWTATVAMPRSAAARAMRIAISPRLAMSSLAIVMGGSGAAAGRVSLEEGRELALLDLAGRGHRQLLEDADLGTL